METESDVYICPQLDYSKKRFRHSSLRHSKLVPLSGTQSVTVTPNGNQETLIEIPSKPFNFAQSFLCFNVDSTAAGANLAVCAPMDYLNEIQQIQIYTRSGQYLCDIPNVDRQTAIIRPIKTPMSEYLSNDTQSKLFPHSRLLYSQTAQAGQATVAATIAAGVPAVNFTQVTHRPDGGAGFADAILEPEHVLLGTTANTAHHPGYQVMFPLKGIANTICAYDKTLYFPEVIVVRILWAAGSKGYWVALNGGGAGVASPDPSTNAAAIGGAVNIVINGISLYLAVEQSLEVAQSIIQKVQSGEFSCVIPYTYVYRFQTTGTGSFSQRFNRGHGMLLTELITSFWNATESSNTTADRSNSITNAAAAQKVTSFYTMLDQTRLTDVNPNAVLAGAGGSTVNEDYLLNRRWIENTVQSIAVDYFRFNSCHIEQFADDRMNSTCPPQIKQNLVTGLPLNVERKYDFQALAGQVGNLNYYLFVTCIKLLSIGAMGITVV